MTEQFVAHRRAFGRLAAGALTVTLVAAGSLTAAAAPAAPPTAPVVAGGGSHPVAAAFSPSGATAYVVDNSAFINVVATGTNTHTGTIFTSGPPPAPNGFLTGAAVSPDGKSLFAAANNTGNGSYLLRFATSTNELVERRKLTNASATGAVAITPDGQTALVWALDSTASESIVYEVNLATGVPTNIPLGVTPASNGDSPTAIAISSDSATAYVTSRSNTVTEIDIAQATVTGQIALTGTPRGLALSADDSTLYAASTDGTISEIDTATNVPTTLATFPTTTFAGIALTPSNDRLVAVGTDSGTSTALVLSAATGDVQKSFLIGSFPWSVAVNPNGSAAYVPTNSGSTSLIPLVEIAPTLIADAAPTSATVGKAYRAQFSATGSPAPTFTATGKLPTGLTLDAATGLLYGTPTKGGTFAFRIVASNGVLPAATGSSHTVKVLALLTAKTPTVSGTTKVGKVLKAKTAAWGPSKVTLKYQWQRLSKGKWVSISKATKTSYKLVKADKKLKVRVVVTGSKSGYVTAAKASKAYTIK